MTEPVVWNGVISVAVKAVLALGLAFGWWHWSDAQTAAVLTATIAIVDVPLTVLTRKQVTPAGG